MCRVPADADGLRTSLPHPKDSAMRWPRLHLEPADVHPDPPCPRRGPHLRLLPGVRVEGLVQGGLRRAPGQGPLAGQRTPLLRPLVGLTGRAAPLNGRPGLESPAARAAAAPAREEPP